MSLEKNLRPVQIFQDFIYCWNFSVTFCEVVLERKIGQLLKALRSQSLIFPQLWRKKNLRFADLVLRFNKASSSIGATEAKTRENLSCLVGTSFYLTHFSPVSHFYTS